MDEMKITKRLAALALVVCAVLSCLPAALADDIWGDMSRSVTFYVNAKWDGARMELNAWKGSVLVDRRGMSTYSQGRAEKDSFGFYEISVSGPGGRGTFVWAPEANQNTDRVILERSPMLQFPAAGTYTVTVRPLSGTEAAAYRNAETIASWRYYDFWRVASLYGCEITGNGPAEPAGVAERDSGTATASVQPVYPYSWETQFVPSQSEKNPRGINTLPRLYDGSPFTYFYYTIWNSERTDEYPELTAFFSFRTVSGLRLINGKVESEDAYYRCARVNKVRAVIYTSFGTYAEYLQAQDVYTTAYQNIPFSRTYSDVTKIELYLENFYKGQGDTQYEMNIAEMQFYQ